jgi:hypothetical protein
MSVAAYGVGRFATPTKVEKVIETVEVVKEVEKKVIEKGPVRYQKVIVEKPGEAKVTTITLQKDPVTITVDHDVERRTTEYVRETVERDAPRLTLGLTGGLSMDGLEPTWGVAANVRILGPLTIGASYTRAGNTVQGFAGLTF